MSLGVAADVSCERAVGHHPQTYECESQTVGGVVRFALDVLAKNKWAAQVSKARPGPPTQSYRLWGEGGPLN